MILTTHCPTCRQQVETKLDDTTTEAAAQAIASRLYCLPCAIERQTQHTLTEAERGIGPTFNRCWCMRTEARAIHTYTLYRANLYAIWRGSLLKSLRFR